MFSPFFRISYPTLFGTIFWILFRISFRIIFRTSFWTNTFSKILIPSFIHSTNHSNTGSLVTISIALLATRVSAPVLMYQEVDLTPVQWKSARLNLCVLVDEWQDIRALLYQSTRMSCVLSSCLFTSTLNTRHGSFLSMALDAETMLVSARSHLNSLISRRHICLLLSYNFALTVYQWTCQFLRCRRFWKRTWTLV